jgi:hypothetical protein
MSPSATWSCALAATKFSRSAATMIRDVGIFSQHAEGACCAQRHREGASVNASGVRCFAAAILLAAGEAEAHHKSARFCFRAGSERLFSLWRANAGQADLVLLVLGVEDGDGVAVCHAYDLTSKRLC